VRSSVFATSFRLATSLKGRPFGGFFERIDRDLVGLREAADRRHFGDAVRLGESIADVPVLDRSQLGQASVLCQKCVLVDRTDAGGIGAERRRHTFGQTVGGEVEVLQHAAARPVDVGERPRR
jgi:hypothetical protein